MADGVGEVGDEELRDQAAQRVAVRGDGGGGEGHEAPGGGRIGEPGEQTLQGRLDVRYGHHGASRSRWCSRTKSYRGRGPAATAIS